MEENGARESRPDVEVVVVGAGFAGLYMLYRLRQLGLSARAFETGDDVGGTWYWNRYPGARCDIPTTDYSYGFDSELEDEWTWSEKYATQPEILRYLQFVAEKHDLRRDITFGTRVAAANWDGEAGLWRIRTDDGQLISCRYYVMASGCLSVPKEVDIEGADRFGREVYFTSRWPHEGVDFAAKRVAVIGTGSSAIQSIPVIAEQAAQLTVFQRTPAYSIPARNGPPPPDALAELKNDRAAYREAAKWSLAGVPATSDVQPSSMVSDEDARARFEAGWERGGLFSVSVFADQAVNPVANERVAEMFREKIRAMVNDPETAEALCPKDYPFGTKRPCLDTSYFETYNLPHVRLVDLRKHPLKTITETGVDTVDESMEFDAIVFATGFDAMTGAVVAVDIEGKDGITLKQKWADGPVTYLGLMTDGFPNLFLVTGPGSPSVLSNMTVSIEQHVEWIADRISDMREKGLTTIEPTATAEAGWVQHVNDCADITLYPRANSWYMGANVPGKPRVFLPYIGGVGPYRAICNEVVERGYLGFELTGLAGVQCNDGIVRRLQPDVKMVLDIMASLDLPVMDTMSPAEARSFSEQGAGMRPPGPDVAEIVDGVCPGAAGDLRYRLYRPEGAGPHSVVVYYHGGGWVLGSHDSDDPFCRDLCARSGAVVVSADYRHAPEHRFPAAVDDAFAALEWVAANTIELGGIPGQLAVAGWSAGGNLATVVARLARDAGGPDLVGQLLVNPVTNYDFSRSSYEENAEGYTLTTAMMRWFWDHYVDPSDRLDPRVSPLRAENLAGLPPATVVYCEFDPLRDEGAAYADALESAGVSVRRVFGRGHTHTSLTMVDIVLSGARVRADIAEALRSFFSATVPA
ncbi:MAG: alpha/beta hydrolase fold domain-containing protein [Acidimicrobiales bacterium]|nr:alpha/beta hydrolase fold domain-containing protein [Acidimicrobiales bacterium]